MKRNMKYAIIFGLCSLAMLYFWFTEYIAEKIEDSKRYLTGEQSEVIWNTAKACYDYEDQKKKEVKQ